LFSLPPLPLPPPLFPYTTLFRSEAHEPLVLGGACDDRHVRLGQRMRLHEPLQHGFRRDEALEIGRELLAALPIRGPAVAGAGERSEEHTSELQSRFDLVCRLLLE